MRCQSFIANNRTVARPIAVQPTSTVLSREMIGPTVPSRMEERHKLPALGIETGNVRPLVKIAEATGQR